MNEMPYTSPSITTGWYKSSYSAANNECVEVAVFRAHVAVRDSKFEHGNRVTVSPSAFTTFVHGMATGRE